jgi:hypothetical protein
MNRSWLPGITVILIGVIYLLTGFDEASRYGKNWWAWFMALGAVYPLERAWVKYRAGVPISKIAWLVTSGLYVLAFAGIFLLDADFGRAWPVLLIVAGIGAILQTRR